ncbi:polysaccharide pyruvyl transferase family protein [Mycetocola saprophilus]|uniref:polysaccharide pyruvyl transferase family protein n=1 Tax=Mycetocola saprophilus TaxID=76636 RepID=UPI003BF366E1
MNNTIRAGLLYDSVSRNTGDIAMGIAAGQLLSARGVEHTIIDPFGPSASSTAPMIVGGGELIRTTGDDFYDRFRPRGPHILNATGIWDRADDLDYLRDYAFVSARSTREAESLAPHADEVEVLPCSTTLMRSEHYQIPGLEEGEPVVGIHLVPHSLRLIDDLLTLINAIPYRKVFIPFTHYNGDEPFMRSLFDMSDAIVLPQLEPLELHSVLGQMRFTVVSSLHASIFSYSQNVPFVSIHQRKAEYYFRDRGLEGQLVRDNGEFQSALERAGSGEMEFTDLIAADAARINAAYDRYIGLLGEGFPAQAAPNAAELAQRTALYLEQADRVIADHDLALGAVEARRLATLGEMRDMYASHRRLEEVVAEQAEQIRRLEEALPTRIGRKLGLIR